MNAEQLFSFAEFVIDAQRPAQPGVYILYAAGKQILCDRIAPRTANYDIICSLNYERINKGLPRILWWAIDHRLRQFKKKGLL